VGSRQTKGRIRRERREVVPMMWEIWASCLEVQEWRRTEEEDSNGE